MSQRLVITVAAAFAFVAKLAFAVSTYGTNDVLFWEADAKKSRAEGGVALYRDGAVPRYGTAIYKTERFNQPPFMIRFFELCAWLGEVSSLPMRFWISLACTVADLVSIPLLLGILRLNGSSYSMTSLLMVIMSPISIFVSGFHGNTDPIMMMLILASVYLIEKGSSSWLAGGALGMAMNIKVVPVLFLLAVALYLRRRREALLYCVSAAIVFLAGSLPEIVQQPLLVWQRVFGYAAKYGQWGVSRLAWALLSPGAFAVYSQWAKPFMAGAIGGASILMNLRRRTPIFLQFSIIAFIFLSTMPGFGVQYLAWLVPWTVLLSPSRAIALHLSSGLFMYSFYDRLSHGAWYLANGLDTPVWYGSVVYLGLLCWCVICVLTLSYGRRLTREARVSN